MGDRMKEAQEEAKLLLKSAEENIRPDELRKLVLKATRSSGPELDQLLREIEQKSWAYYTEIRHAILRGERWLEKYRDLDSIMTSAVEEGLGFLRRIQPPPLPARRSREVN